MAAKPAFVSPGFVVAVDDRPAAGSKDCLVHLLQVAEYIGIE